MLFVDIHVHVHVFFKEILILLTAHKIKDTEFEVLYTASVHYE